MIKRDTRFLRQIILRIIKQQNKFNRISILSFGNNFYKLVEIHKYFNNLNLELCEETDLEEEVVKAADDQEVSTQLSVFNVVESDYSKFDVPLIKPRSWRV